MKLIKSDYKILHSNERTMLIKLTVPYYKIMELQLMGRIISSEMLPIKNSNEGISFILSEEYKGKCDDLVNICTGADIILAALQEAEGKYLAVMYTYGVTINREDRKFILPMCTAYKVIMKCEKEMVDKVIDKIKLC